MPFAETIDSIADPTMSLRPVAGADSAPGTISAGTMQTLTTGAVREFAAATTPGGSPGAYEFRKPLGRGGMGEVWQALQVSLGRVVAVKRPVLEGSAKDASRLSAFRQEALVAAQLEHPNIVPVHDQGIDSEGRPLLAMKLVQGRSWDQMLREDFDALKPEELLEKHLPIFVDVVQAVAFAHSRGIIHRDLKPAQVMVGSFGEVMLMDWGLAMFIGDPEALEGRVRHDFPTRESCTNPSGTPALMAPEQTRHTAGELSERTDVYLLGGTLYYILTGTYPHQAKTANEAILRAASGRLQHPQERIAHPLPEELVAICLEALAFEPKQRTPSAAALLRQLRDYLSGASRRREANAIADRLEALLAGEPRDYETLTGAISDLTRAFGLWPAGPRLVPLRDRLLEAYARAAIAREDLNLAEVQARQIGDSGRAQPLLAEVRRGLDRRRRQATQRRLAVGAALVLLALLGGGSALFNVRLAEERDIAQAARTQAVQERDEAQRQRARAVEAETVAETRRREVESKSAAVRAARAEADGLVGFMLGDLRQRLADLKRLDMLDGVAARSAEYYAKVPLAQLDATERLQTVAGMRSLCDVFLAQGNVAEAARICTLAQEAAERARAEAPGDLAAGLELLQTLGLRCRIFQQQGDLDSALQMALKAIELGESLIAQFPESRDAQILTAIVFSEQKSLFKALGRLPDATAAAQESVRILEAVVAAEPGNTRAARELSSSLSGLGSAHVDEDNNEAGIDALERSRDIMKSLTELQPQNEGWRLDYAQTLQSAGYMMAESGDLDGAQAQLELALAIFEGFVEKYPTKMDLLADAAKNLYYLAQFEKRRGNAEAAEAFFRRAIARADQLSERDPANVENRHIGVVTRFGLGELIVPAGRVEEAVPLYRKNVATLDSLLELEPTNNAWRRDLAANLYSLAETLSCSGTAEEVRGASARAIATYQELQAKYPKALILADMEQSAVFQLSRVSRAEGDWARALEEESRRLPVIERLGKAQQDDDTWPREKAGALLSVAGDLVALGRLEEASARIAEALAVIDSGEPGKRPWEFLRGRAEIAEGRVLRALGSEAEGVAKMREGCARIAAALENGGLKGASGQAVWDLADATRALGDPVPAEWTAYLRSICFFGTE